MSRVQTTNYLGETHTSFEYATDDNDPFDRNDISYVARALEEHDHTAGKGLALTADSFADGTIDSDKLATGGVATANIADDAVTRDKIAPNAIGTTEIEDGKVTGAKIPANAISASHLQTDSVGADEIVAQGVGTAEIANLAVTTGKLANLAVDNTKMAVGAAEDNLGFLPVDTHSELFATFVNALATGESGFFEINSTQTDGPVPGTAYYLLQLTETNQPTGYAWQVATNINNQNDTYERIVVAGSPGVWRKRWHAGNDGSGSGLDAGTVGGYTVADIITAASGGGGGSISAVPTGGVIWFQTAAELASAGVSWETYTAGAGRFLIGAGTTDGQTFTENTAVGSSWSHLHSSCTFSVSATGAAVGGPEDSTGTESGGTLYDEDETGGGHNAREGHTHSLNGVSFATSVTGSATGSTSSAVFIPMSRVGVWGRKI